LVTENAAVIRACEAITVAQNEGNQRIERPGRRHLEEGIADLVGMGEQHRALAEVVEHERRHRHAEPGRADRPLAEVAQVGIERLGAGHAEHHRPEGDERNRRMAEQEQQRVVRRERLQDRDVVANVGQAEHCKDDEPHRHHRAEQPADALGTVTLEEKESGENDERDRHDPGVQSRGRDLQALDRGEHRDRRRDDAVAEEDRGPENADEEQTATQLRAVPDRLRSERKHGDQTTLAVVVGAQDEGDVLDRDDDREGPEHQRENAVDVVLGEGHMAVREHLLQGVERAGADVAIDDADGTERQREQAGSGAVLGHADPAGSQGAPRRRRRRRTVIVPLAQRRRAPRRRPSVYS
jgi:hypothetical protein